MPENYRANSSRPSPRNPARVLSNLGPQIQWVESYVMDEQALLRLHRAKRRTDSRTCPAGRFSREPNFRGPRNHRSDHCRIARRAKLDRTVKPSQTAGRTPTIRPVAFPRWLLLPRETAEQKHAQHDKENVRKPDEQFRVRMRIPAQRIANDYEQEIGRSNNQAHGESN